ncbi:patched domain-containing protein 3 [Plakobranchus ocellatus]|uniref:Patched domain-containing protein 3 n=1 Tax=Plakobranchus ocellatus TaxID=259542 RepID=A0AAV3WXH0_9GAST|nr:patched domain-containing protein 3 [Plakobranchus ocellatus]
MSAITRALENFQRGLLQVFYKYGYFLACHPYWFLIVPTIVCGALSVGILTVHPESDSEALYAPRNSRAIKDRATVEQYFPELSGTHFHPFCQNRLVPEAFAIFRSRERMAIFNDNEIEELKNFRDQVTSIDVTDGDRNYTYSDLCAKESGVCFIDGDFLLGAFFKSALKQGSVSYPLWNPLGQPIDLRRLIGDVTLSSSGTLSSANAIELGFPMRRDTAEMEKLSLKWELEYIEFMKTVNFTFVEVTYATSQSLDIELDKGTTGDIFLFALTFTLMILYTTVASMGGDCVSTRALLANGGVLATILGITGAFGVISAAGVQFVNVVGVMPFLTLGIGVDDMFLLMSGWSETLSMPDLTVPERIGVVFKKAGIGITITSGVGVLLCYICNASIFGACLTFHGRRVFSRRHTVTCLPVTKSREELQAEGGSCYALACSGEIPRSPSQDQSICERGPRAALTKFLMLTPIRVMVIVVFAAYLGVAAWGCTKLQQGLDLKHLVLTTSYFYKYQSWFEQDFGNWVPVSFVTTHAKQYSSAEALQEMQGLLNTVHQDSYMDSQVESCWLTSLANTHYYDTTSDSAFITGLHQFLADQTRFYNDVVFDSTNQTIIASRCHVSTTKLIDSNDEANMMITSRRIADASPADVFAYSEPFVLIEQFVTILYSTLKTVGCTLAVMLVVTIVFLPNPVIVALVMLQVVMILVGVFGFMAHWNLTLSSVTMIHLIMSVGFSVDFCAHVCTAYMVSDETTRQARALDALVHASGPILNGGFSSMLGVLVLSMTKSYIFKSFFKVMLLVIGFGAAHAILLVPVMLSIVGPNTYIRLEKSDKGLLSASLSSSGEEGAPGSSSEEKVIPRPSSRRKISPVTSQAENESWPKTPSDCLDEDEYQYQNNGFCSESSKPRAYK